MNSTPARFGVLSCSTYVDEVTLAVQHDVAIVSVLDLQQEEQKAVSSHAADEVVASLLGGKLRHYYRKPASGCFS